MISKANIQLVKGLQDKKQRQKYDQFVVEGQKSITELLTSNLEVVKIFALPQWIKANHVDLQNHEVIEIDEKDMKQISSFKTPNSVLAVVRKPAVKTLEKGDQFVLGLDEIQDPGNMGTIIRIADWYGIKQIVCSKGCTDHFAPKCISSTMGSFLRVDVIYGDIIELAKQGEYPLIVTTMEGANIHHTSLPNNGMLIIGNEGHGIHPNILSQAEHCLGIPRFGKAESLNAAVSTAIVLDNLMR